MTSVHLRPVEPTDYAALRRFELDLTLGPRWRHRGATPSPEAFVQALWSGVLALYLVESSHRREPVGLVSAYGHDLQSGFAWLASGVQPKDEASTLRAPACSPSFRNPRRFILINSTQAR